MECVERHFGATPAGEPLVEYEVDGGGGLRGTFLSWGATVRRLQLADARGAVTDLVLGFDDPQDYLGPHPYVGCAVGRSANRIGGARFVLDGREHVLEANDGCHHLHGGAAGLSRAAWYGEVVRDAESIGVRFRCASADGAGGFPGRLEAAVALRITARRELVVEERATTDRPTVVNLSHHGYFNLAGGGDVLGHLLQIHAARFTPVDVDGIPTGALAEVAGTPLDFRTPTAIGARIGDLADGRGGYDHNFALDGATPPYGTLLPAARVIEPVSGRTLAVSTTKPGLQFYSGNFLDGTLRGHGGRTIPHRGGFCLEAQFFPDAPNQPAFPSTRLEPGQEWRHVTVYAFGGGA